MFYEPHRFAFAALLEQHWRTIYAEYLAIQREAIDWHEKKLYGQGWQVFGLFNFPHGEPLAENIGKCPATASLIRDHVPAHGAAGFSVLRPGTRIAPHEGYAGSFLRCHLGLQVPEGDCALKVGDETQKWQTGKVFIFDDRLTHEAWNLTQMERVILLVDFRVCSIREERSPASPQR